MRGTERWLCPKTGLVHQLKFRNVMSQGRTQLMQGTTGSWYAAARDEVIAVLWEPVCGGRRKKNMRVGKHEGPVTCLACLGGGYED